MSVSCGMCGSGLDAGRFCPACGAEQRTRAGVDPNADVFVGRTISDRYEVKELINVGAMGRVYRAHHLALDRKVAIKFIHPHLLTADAIVTRFMIEAKTASRLNHPNVVSIFDFGRTPAATGAHLFLVMEFLSGPDLSAVMRSGDTLLPLWRIADVLCQTLAALGEAHHLGITHRDVKPENIILEPKRFGGDHVKVIDFGIAKLGGAKRLTAVGQIVGTPHYMAPEQACGREVSPSADLYSVGVMLYEMLTGQMPFDGESPESVLLQHVKAPRPDPRTLAPARGISEQLAAVCRRAIDIEPTARFSSADALAKAILAAIPEASLSSRRAALFSSAPPTRPSTPSSGIRSTRSLAATVAAPATAAPEPIMTAAEAPRDRSEDTKPLVGRTADLAWAGAGLDDHVLGLTVWGRAGSGRSRLLRAIAALAQSGQAGDASRVVHVPVARPPRGEISCSGLRAIIRCLVGVKDPLTVAGGAAHLELDGLGAIMHGELPTGDLAAVSVRRSTAAALAWAVRCASRAADGRRVVLVLDDSDQLDSVSRAALADLLTRTGLPRFVVLASTISAPDSWPSERVRVREIEGLSRADAEEMLSGNEGALPAAAAGDILPLYLEQLMRWQREEPLQQAAPPRLWDMVLSRMRKLEAAQRRIVEALAVVGDGSSEAIAEVLRGEDVVASIEPLSEAGFVSQRASGNGVTLAHQLFGDVAIAIAPRGAIAELHARAADRYASRPGKLELRAYHAIRGRPDQQAFLLLEESARHRAAHGDDDGAILVLQQGLHTARADALRGDPEATSRCIAFGQKLGAALVSAGRTGTARGVLAEILDLTGPHHPERTLILQQLELIADVRERPVRRM